MVIISLLKRKSTTEFPLREYYTVVLKSGKQHQLCITFDLEVVEASLIHRLTPQNDGAFHHIKKKRSQLPNPPETGAQKQRPALHVW